MQEIPEDKGSKITNNYSFDVINIDDIKIIGDNPNIMSALELQSLKYSIEKFDVLSPILIDQNNNLINGHKRYEVCKSLGHKTIPVIKTEVKDEIQRLLMIQAFNKIHGKHDDELDKKIYGMVLAQNQNNMIDLLALTVEEDAQRIYDLLNPTIESSDDEPSINKNKKQRSNKDVICPECGKSFSI